jgi:hypothetical protein
VYVANVTQSENYVTVLNGNGKQVLRTLSFNYPVIGMAVDLKGHLFVAPQAPTGVQTLEIYGKQGASLLQTLSQKNHAFYAPTLDKSGNLFAYCGSYEVCEFPAGGKNVVKNKVIWKLRLSKYRLSGQLAVDASGDLAIGGMNEVWVFHPGQSQAFWKISSNSILGAIAFTQQGNLLVGSSGSGSGPGSISVYSPQETIPSEDRVPARGV